MYRFQRRLKDVSLGDLDLCLIDFYTIPIRARRKAVEQFDRVFGANFLARKFPEEKLCRTVDCLNSLYGAYMDYRDARLAVGEAKSSVESLEDWSRVNGARHVIDHITLPHQGVRWFALRSISTGEQVGAMQISQIELMGIENKQAKLCGHAIMTLPQHATFTYPQYWGEVIKALIDKPFVFMNDSSRSVVFDEWVLPTSSPARYVSRRGNNFGEQIMSRAGIDTLVERGDASVDHAPKSIRKTVRGSRNDKQTLKVLRDEVTRE